MTPNRLFFRSGFNDLQAVLFGEGDGLVITAGHVGVRFLQVSGRPLGEPVAWYGPIVMNTEKELEVTRRELNEGTFIKG